MKILHLTLKKKWFDMIFSGEKKEEYREIKGFWVRRLCKGFNVISWNPFLYTLQPGEFEPLKFDAVCFKNGYAKDAREMTLEFNGTSIGEGKSEWGAPCYRVFKIGLGPIISTKNIITH